MSSPNVVSFDERVVVGASDPAVTRHACPRRQLLAVQQVMATRYLAQRDKTKTSFTAYCMPLNARLAAAANSLPRVKARRSSLVKRGILGRSFSSVMRPIGDIYPMHLESEVELSDTRQRRLAFIAAIVASG